ncbi:hypothetical protein CRM22_004205 [Opisthorchis felineus]|uniref:Secreted protein n=1 Tax=Opisthorchis felineus TaxID=147828 RepID=A0A4S2LXE6_OPIFE|nr:hypothetical protein CRM22_004205 [Opisthorchis felineus]
MMMMMMMMMMMTMMTKVPQDQTWYFIMTRHLQSQTTVKSNSKGLINHVSRFIKIIFASKSQSALVTVVVVVVVKPKRKRVQLGRLSCLAPD